MYTKYSNTISLTTLPFDVDAQAFFNRVTTAGGTLSTTERLAINTLVLQMKADGTWTKAKAIYPMVGSSAAACSQNLKSSSYTGTFSSGWTFSATGAKPNGTSAYMDTNFNCFNELTLHNNNISIYSRTDVKENSSDYGSYTSAFSVMGINIRYNDSPSGTIYVANQREGGSTDIILPNPNSLGFYQSNRTSSTLLKAFKNTTTLGTNTTLNNGVYPNRNVFLGALNFSGTPNFFASRETAFFSIGEGLSDTEAINYYNSVQAFQTTLGRQV